MSIPERVRTLIEPLVDDAGLHLYDLELNGGVLRVVVEPLARATDDSSGADPAAGVGMDDITAVTRAISRAIDEHDPIDGRFTLEVSSPGLERTLRTPAHFQGAVGQVVTIKTTPVAGGDRRFRGLLTEADAHGVVVVADVAPDVPRRLAYDDIERARTVFEWGPTPKPGGAGRGSKRTPSAAGAVKARAARSPKKSTKKSTKKVTAS